MIDWQKERDNAIAGLNYFKGQLDLIERLIKEQQDPPKEEPKDG